MWGAIEHGGDQGKAFHGSTLSCRPQVVPICILELCYLFFEAGDNGFSCQIVVHTIIPSGVLLNHTFSRSRDYGHKKGALTYVPEKVRGYLERNAFSTPLAGRTSCDVLSQKFPRFSLDSSRSYANYLIVGRMLLPPVLANQASSGGSNVYC